MLFYKLVLVIGITQIIYYKFTIVQKLFTIDMTYPSC